MRRASGPAPLALAIALVWTTVAVPRAQGQGTAAPPVTTGGDSTRVPAAGRAVRTVRVEVTRDAAPAARLPWAVGVQERGALQRGQPTVGIDEALPNVPGVFVANRYNFALDQRLSIRGAGSRANFGLRGVKVLLDGVPQSLPDGQGQLTNVDLAAVDRVEVLRGSASSLYGNGSGGVLSFRTDLSAPDPLGARLRVTGGSFGLRKTQGRVSGRAGRGVGALSFSRTSVDGFRQYSSAELRQWMGAGDWGVDERTTVQLRGSWADTPEALNPGALTLAEYRANPDSAALVNVRRGAAREVRQRQGSVRLVRRGAHGAEMSVTLFGITRGVDNALATPPPPPAGAANGIFATLDRHVWGGRLDAARDVGAHWRVAVGADLQRMADRRKNQRSSGGRPVAAVDTLLLDQDEIVASVGPFVQVTWTPDDRVTVSVGGRHDQLRFQVRDFFRGDGADNTGARTMAAWSGHAGLSVQVHPALIPYANVATAFETPTTTELQVRPDGLGGFNPTLAPQRARTVEVGARGAMAGGRMRYTVSAYGSRVRDAIIQFLALDGRAFFENAGATRQDGLEVGLEGDVTSWLALTGAWTASRFRFATYRIPRGSALDTLDGRSLAGVPDRFVRLGARLRLGPLTLDGDHTLSGGLWADDRNTLRVPGWGRGQLNVRAAADAVVGRWRAEPFVAVNNAFDQRYVGSVTINGAGARVLEPAPRRNWVAGVQLDAALRR